MFGCDSHLSRKRFVVRDESLRVALAAAAPTPQHQWMWMRGDEVRLSPPDDDDARAGPFGQAGSSANASLPKRQRLVAGLDSLAASSAGKRRASGQQDSHAGAAAAKHPRSSSAGVAIKMETQTAEGLPEQEGEDEQIRSLAAYLESRGGTRDMVDGWRANTETRREGRFAGYSDRYFFDPSGKRFRSHPEVARHFKLEAAPHIRRRTCLPSSAASATTRAHAADTPAFTSAEEDPDIYEVERILGERRRGGRAQFLIRWLGCAPPTPRLAHASPRVACYTCDENGARRVTQG